MNGPREGDTIADPPRPVCGRCGGITFERVQRVSFFQRQIMPFFNRYPWRCVFCNRITFRRQRKNSELFRG